MSDTEAGRVALAGPEGDEVFQGLKGLLGHLDLALLHPTSGSDLLSRLSLMGVRPAVLLLSTAIDEDDLGDPIRAIKEEFGTEVIVCATQSNREREIQARAAGVFCYLVLPTEEMHVGVAVQAALAKHRAGVSKNSL